MTQTVPILETILHPPLGLLQRELIPGLLSGSVDLTRNTGSLAPFNNVNAYGLSWAFFTVPIGFGFEIGFPDVYFNRMLQASTVHTDFAGHELVSEYHSFFSEGIYWLWQNPGPSRVHLEIEPGVELQAFWLIVRIP